MHYLSEVPSSLVLLLKWGSLETSGSFKHVSDQVPDFGQFMGASKEDEEEAEERKKEGRITRASQ